MPLFKDTYENQNMILPIVLKKHLIPGTFEQASCYIIDKLDLSKIEAKYDNDEKGVNAYNPGMLLKIIINAYVKGIFSSRKIEELRRENILFIAILGDTVPDHTTIANFITNMEQELLEIFQQVLLICAQCELIGG